ncbi:MAG: hypothetical protein E7598_05000 [Ruminococcaceae bacterium]|nr:hypothetical protein [Oscillospiraceae bacterium]
MSEFFSNIWEAIKANPTGWIIGIIVTAMGVFLLLKIIFIRRVARECDARAWYSDTPASANVTLSSDYFGNTFADIRYNRGRVDEHWTQDYDFPNGNSVSKKCYGERKGRGYGYLWMNIFGDKKFVADPAAEAVYHRKAERIEKRRDVLETAGEITALIFAIAFTLVSAISCAIFIFGFSTGTYGNYPAYVLHAFLVNLAVSTVGIIFFCWNDECEVWWYLMEGIVNVSMIASVLTLVFNITTVGGSFNAASLLFCLTLIAPFFGLKHLIENIFM